MPLNSQTANSQDLFSVIEPLFIEHFKLTHGDSPSITELKQHLVNTGIDKLTDHVHSLNTRITELYTHSDIVNTIGLYIRKLK